MKSVPDDPSFTGPATNHRPPSTPLAYPDDALILSRKHRIELGDVVVTHSLVDANPGIPVGGRRLTVTLYRGTAQQFSWRSPESDRIRSRLVLSGSVQISATSESWWLQWPKPASMLIVATRLDLPANIAADLSLQDFGIPTQIGIEDRTTVQFVRLFEQELANEGANGRLYVESLMGALTVHLLNRHAAKPTRRVLTRGGLPPAQLRRVLDYIELRLSGDICLAELARLTGLSAHHFGQAFMASMGRPPHRYLIERRIRRATELLAETDLSIAEIAINVGFSNQSHFTFNFRKLMTTTPARYRWESTK